jgi:dTDP-4-dehydrorhamnose reductase
MIWLIGNKGMLGTELSLMLEKTDIPFIGTDRDVDITSLAALENFAEESASRIRPVTWIINCAAYTAVDKAEDDADSCRKINTDGPANIALCTKQLGAKMIHISTDYVFDGKGNRPYREDDPTNPIGVYGRAKRDGELAVMCNNPRSYIIRTAWLYGRHGNNFVSTMLRLMNERSEISVVDDQRGSPTFARGLASAIIQIVKAGDSLPFGIYHYTDLGDITWFDFAREIYRQGRSLGLVNKDCAVRPCTSAEYPAKVKRPAYSVLDKTKIQHALGIDIPEWNESLKDYLRCLHDSA